MRPVGTTTVPGFISMQVEGLIKDAKPQEQKAVVVEPTKLYDMEDGAVLGIDREAQSWYIGTPQQWNVVHKTRFLMVFRQRTVVALVDPMNARYKEWMRMLLNPESEGKGIVEDL